MHNKIILGAVLLVAAVYYLAIRPTVEVYVQYKQNCGSDMANEMIGVSPGYTADRVKQVNAAYDLFRVDTLQWKNKLWNVASGLCSKYKAGITAYPPVRAEVFGGQAIFRQQIGFSGSYHELLKLLQEAEATKEVGLVSGVVMSRKPRAEYLTLNIDFTGFQKIK